MNVYKQQRAAYTLLLRMFMRAFVVPGVRVQFCVVALPVFTHVAIILRGRMCACMPISSSPLLIGMSGGELGVNWGPRTPV
jgi:hypothetical protein